MLELTQVSKFYGKQPILQDLSFSLSAKKTLSILGKSGSGKSTLLKIIAGLERADQGEIWVGGERLNDLSPAQRNIVYLYQEALLFPHLNVWENLVFALKIRFLSPKIIQEKGQELLYDLGLEAHRDKMPHQLSGGQQQRLAFGRALIIGPRLLLLDEPFSSLDPSTRDEMRILLKRLSQKYSSTLVFVTHDLKEALEMGDQMAYLRQGKLETYSSKKAFIEDERTGVKREMSFWQDIKKN